MVKTQFKIVENSTFSRQFIAPTTTLNTIGTLRLLFGCISATPNSKIKSACIERARFDAGNLVCLGQAVFSSTIDTKEVKHTYKKTHHLSN